MEKGHATTGFRLEEFSLNLSEQTAPKRDPFFCYKFTPTTYTANLGRWKSTHNLNLYKLVLPQKEVMKLILIIALPTQPYTGYTTCSFDSLG